MTPIASNGATVVVGLRKVQLQQDANDEINLVLQGECLKHSFRKPKDDTVKIQDQNKTDLTFGPEAKESWRRLRIGRHRIPFEILCGPDEEIDGGCISEEHVNQIDLSVMCMELLESGDYEDNRIGIERLIVVVNGELVNSKLEDSVALALVFGNDSDDRCMSRIRTAFPSIFRSADDSRQDKESRKRDSFGSQSSEEVSLYSDLTGSTAIRQLSLELPALRVLVSSLELCSKIRNRTINLSDAFWQPILVYMTESLEPGTTQRISMAMVLKCFRLLRKMEPQTMEPYLKYSLLPSILNAKEYGHSSRDKMIVRECEMLLQCL